MTENGAYTEKYDRAAEMIAVYDTLSDYLVKPERPEYVPPLAYPDIKVTEMLTYQQIIDQVVIYLLFLLPRQFIASDASQVSWFDQSQTFLDSYGYRKYVLLLWKE